MRILLIEDDRKVATALKKNLRAEGYAVDIAPDGLVGEEYALVTDYDLIILDIMLPGQDGWAVCRRIRNMGVLTPILMLTALNDVDDRIRGLNEGADDYLAKPFHFGELKARIRALIRRDTTSRTTVLSHFGVQLNQDTRTATRDGRTIVLSAKEYALLELFMLYPGKVLTRSEISEHVWDMNFEPRSNVIDSFVRFLRRKVDADFDRRLIHTVRGLGYMFTDEEL